MIENENKKRANHREFLQGGEPPLIGRARSSQKTSFRFVFTFSNLSLSFFLFTHTPFFMIYFLSAMGLYFSSLTSPLYIFFSFLIYHVFFSFLYSPYSLLYNLSITFPVV